MYDRARLAAFSIVAGLTLALGAGTIAAAADYVAPDGRTEAELIAAHVLPDPAVTPGVLNPDVTPDTLQATVCVPGWTATVRPSDAYTDALKLQDLAPGMSPDDCEEDHLFALLDGGHPRDRKNLWCMVYDDLYGARVKDRLETRVGRLLCAGRITLDQARAALSPNWLVGYVQYVGPLPTPKGKP